MSGQDNEHWYLVYTKPRKESVAEFHLRLKGVGVFLPWFLRAEFARRRKQIVPLFPNYLFVHIDFTETYYQVLWTPGVKRFVSFNGDPTPLEGEVVEYLIKQANSEGVIKGRSHLKAGQEVEISSGPFKGLAAIIQDPPDAKGRVKVLLNILKRQVKAEVPVQFVKSGWVI